MKYWQLISVLLILFAGTPAIDAMQPQARSSNGNVVDTAFPQPFSIDELREKSPFDPAVQQRMFYIVARIMFIKKIDPEIPMPEVMMNKDVPVRDMPAYLGFALQTNNINFFSHLKNTILLSEDAAIHVLAHEMAHYFQFHYHLRGDIKNMHRDPEPEAVRIQRRFEPPLEPPLHAEDATASELVAGP